MSEIIITNHAYVRAKERLKLTRKQLDSFIPKVIERGKEYKDENEELTIYLQQKKIKYDNKAKKVILYGDSIFVFDEMRLVTIFTVPRKLKHDKHRKVKFYEGD